MEFITLIQLIIIMVMGIGLYTAITTFDGIITIQTISSLTAFCVATILFVVLNKEELAETIHNGGLN